MPNGISAVSTVASLDYPSLFAQPGLVCPDVQGNVSIRLQNCGDEDLRLPRCTIVGYIENTKNPDFEELSLIDEDEWKAKMSQTEFSPPPPMSQTEREEFLAQARINVPAEEAVKYEDLLCKHYDVFSKSKSDLGSAKNFEHKIELKDDSPVYLSRNILYNLKETV